MLKKRKSCSLFWIRTKNTNLFFFSMETSEYWELLAKQRLGYCKEGEVVYKVFKQDG